MSATMARQGGQVQLEQSVMRLALNMAKMAKEGFLRAAKEETKYLIKKPRCEAREERKRGAEIDGHKTVMAAIQRHPALLCQIHTSGGLTCQNGTAKNPQTHRRRTGSGAPPLIRLREPTAEPTPPLPGTAPAPTGNTSRAQPSRMVILQPYIYIRI
jgi:hypothetical protein